MSRFLPLSNRKFRSCNFFPVLTSNLREGQLRLFHWQDKAGQVK